jgi:hypothetical protein
MILNGLWELYIRSIFLNFFLTCDNETAPPSFKTKHAMETCLKINDSFTQNKKKVCNTRYENIMSTLHITLFQWFAVYFLEGVEKLQNGCKAQNFHCL